MEFVIINVLFYLFTVLIYWRRRHVVDVYFGILLLYLLTAFMCALNFSDSSNEWKDLQLVPFVYLFFVLLIFFSPVKNFHFDRSLLIKNDNKYLKYLSYFYIICSAGVVMITLPDAIARSQSGEWGELRSALYADEDSIELYSSAFERLLKNLTSYLSPFIIPYSFIQLTKEKISVVYVLILFASYLLPSFISATVVASRGMVLNDVFTLLMCYLLFRQGIPQNRKKYIYIGSASLFISFLFYSIAVTISRFGDSDAGNSVFSYFGHSMLSFNDGIFNNLHDHAWGKYYFKWFIDILGGNSSFNITKAGATSGSSFFTMVGGLYIDFGLIGTIIVALLVSKFMKIFFRNFHLHISDCVMIVFYISSLAQGIFVFGRGRALTWLMTFVVYLIVRKLESKVKFQN